MNILIVEDNPNTQEALEDLLKLDNHKVDYAGNGLGALVRLKTHPADIVIVDYHMPAMNGLELAAELRKNEQWKDIPIILITAVADSELPIADILLLLGVYLLRKPFSIHELREVITKIHLRSPE